MKSTILNFFKIVIIFFPLIAFSKSLPVDCLQRVDVNGKVDFNCLESVEEPGRSPSSISTDELSGQMSPAASWGNYPVQSTEKWNNKSGTYGNYILNPEVPISKQKIE